MDVQCRAHISKHSNLGQPLQQTNCAGVVPSGTWRTKDGKYVVVGGNGDSIYSRLMAAVGRQDMAADNPAYADNSRRCEREAEINEASASSVALVDAA